MSQKGLYVQYGCGLSAPTEWINFDTSPTLRIQKIPLLGRLLKNQLPCTFPANVRIGNIITGLPVPANSCLGVYSSHILEHLCLNDFRKALENTYTILQPGGLFRCIVPDLETYARQYVAELESGDPRASHRFLSPWGERAMLGVESRPRGAKGILTALLGNSHHLWMWDRHSLTNELQAAGFVSIRPCAFNDSTDPMFRYVEDPDRFQSAVVLECTKQLKKP
ncbi:class I SAM-dependent methyltransferase [Spirosoma aureum]|uniref:Class I SAM-dependent methyltransferase n=1 Tax=Spirosoma aureum TaxID=2692134 RepID=A0A6G9ALN5_9BACT|nr:methyltransferase domain-containing protein [Spirosoma aureum]QIP13357.1 class I SAM-dependent methyltransferase [Spirosoma aureum]